MGNLTGKNWKKALFLAGFAGALFFALKYLFPLAAPFLLAFLLVHLCNPWLEGVRKKTHIRKEIVLGGILLLVAAALLGTVWALFSWGSVHASGIGEGMGQGCMRQFWKKWKALRKAFGQMRCPRRRSVPGDI